MTLPAPSTIIVCFLILVGCLYAMLRILLRR